MTLQDKKKKVILICDDDADVRKIVVAMVRGRYDVLEASDGKIALDVIEAHAPYLMILDLAMPNLDGLETLRRALKQHPYLVVTMLTGDTDIEKAKEALDLGARAYVTKPISCDPEELYRIIDPGTYDATQPPWKIGS